MSLVFPTQARSDDAYETRSDGGDALIGDPGSFAEPPDHDVAYKSISRRLACGNALGQITDLGFVFVPGNPALSRPTGSTAFTTVRTAASSAESTAPR